MTIKNFILEKMQSAVFTCGAVSALSFTALAAAFTSEVFGLEPCILCVYQRYPYAIAMFLGLIGLALRKNSKAVGAILALCSLLFLGNSALAFYHSGVELHWWDSFSESCTIFQFDTEKQSLLENILSTPLGHCDQIAWKDPVLGWSMANHNVVVCLLLAKFCSLASFMSFRKSRAQSSQPSQP